MLTRADIEKYFVAEKHESLLFIVIGISAIVLSIVFYFLLKTTGYRGAAIPLLLIGLLQTAAGFAVYSKSDDQRINNVYAYDMNPDQLKTVELSRMNKVNANFLVYRWIQIALIVTGLVLIILYHSNAERGFWLGLGIALAIQSSVLLFADYTAARRARIYTNQLETFTGSMRDPSPG